MRAVGSAGAMKNAVLILAAISPTSCPVTVKDTPKYLHDKNFSKGTPSRIIVPGLDVLTCSTRR